MLRRRLIYAGVLLFTAAAAFFFGKTLLAVIAAGLALFLPILKLLITLDARHISLALQLQAGRGTGDAPTVTVLTRRTHPLLAAGTVRLSLEWDNLLMDDHGSQSVLFPVTLRTVSHTAALENTACGELRVRCPGAQYITLYPSAVSVRISEQEPARDVQQSEQSYLRRPGADLSEVFDLRGYVPGDDPRNIHWKLSNKLDTLLVRQGSTPSHSRLALLLDAGHSADGAPVSTALLEGAIALACAVSGRLTALTVPHQALFFTGQDLDSALVGSPAQHADLLVRWMQLHLPEESGLGLELFSAAPTASDYSHLIYITAGAIPPVRPLSPDLHVSFLCVTDGDAPRLYQQGGWNFAELPLAALNDGGLTITL